jgi:predicted nucleic acid-binding protein
MSDSFVDTNVLLYLTSDDPAKADVAERLLRSRPVISVQVLNEFASVGRRKFRLAWPEVEHLLTAITSAADVHAVTLTMHQKGIALARDHNFHIYDATIVAAAIEAGCSTLYTEDMHHGLLVDGRLRIVNPFA